MYVRASFTVENSVIIPVFILIFMGLIAMTGYYHDKIIIKGAVEQTAVKLEMLEGAQKEIEIMNMQKQLQKYIEKKTLFMKKIRVEIKESNGSYMVNCSSNYGLNFVRQLMGQKKTCGEVNKNNPCRLIRVSNATMEVIGK